MLPAWQLCHPMLIRWDKWKIARRKFVTIWRKWRRRREPRADSVWRSSLWVPSTLVQLSLEMGDQQVKKKLLRFYSMPLMNWLSCLSEKAPLEFRKTRNRQASQYCWPFTFQPRRRRSQMELKTAIRKKKGWNEEKSQPRHRSELASDSGFK